MRFVYLFLFSKSFISLPPSFFNSYIRFVYLFLSFRAVHFAILLSFIVSILVLHPLRLPPPFLSRVHFIASVLSLQLYASIRYFFPFRFNSSLLFPIPRSFRFKLSSSLRYFLPIVSMLPSCSLSFTIPFVSRRSFCYFPSFCFNVFIQFVYLFLSFQAVHFVTSFLIFLSLQLFSPVRLALPFLSTRPFHCVRPFVATLPSIRYFLPFVSTLFHPFRYSFPSLLTLPFRFLWRAFRFNSSLPSINSSPSFQRFHPVNVN